MFSQFTAKFAQTSLRLFGREGRFEIDIPTSVDLDDVAREYESYGHVVERQAAEHRITVICTQ